MYKVKDHYIPPPPPVTPSARYLKDGVEQVRNKVDKIRITKEQYNEWRDYESTSKESGLVSVCIMSIVVLVVSFIVTSSLI